MGIGIKMLNPSNYRTMMGLAKISAGLELHLKKSCAYCDLDFGNEIPVIEFVEHMATKHEDKILPEDIKKYRRLIAKITK